MSIHHSKGGLSWPFGFWRKQVLSKLVCNKSSFCPYTFKGQKRYQSKCKWMNKTVLTWQNKCRWSLSLFRRAFTQTHYFWVSVVGRDNMEGIYTGANEWTKFAVQKQLGEICFVICIKSAVIHINAIGIWYA